MEIYKSLSDPSSQEFEKLLNSQLSKVQIEGEPWSEVIFEHQDEIANIEIAQSRGNKCERCWHRRPEVGTIAKHGTLCSRCVENIEGAGEIRIFA